VMSATASVFHFYLLQVMVGVTQSEKGVKLLIGNIKSG
jgi:hypothetical protein